MGVITSPGPRVVEPVETDDAEPDFVSSLVDALNGELIGHLAD
jgi:hypothetical protein